MFEYSQSKKQIKTKRQTLFLIIGIFAMIMAIGGVHLVCSLFPLDGYTVGDVIGLIFLIVWTLIVFGMGLFAFETNSKQLIINDDGVLCSSWWRKEFVKWCDIKDWGLSYCGQTRGEGNTYYLYFSTEVQSAKNDCSKKLKGKMLRTHVFEKDYAEAVDKVIPFCSERTPIEPFVGMDKYHFM